MRRVCAHDTAGENTTSFFVTFAAAPVLDGRYEVVGNLLEGAEVLARVEALGNWRGELARPVRISRCGELRVPTGERQA